jgi:hypothetical protein
MRLLTLALLIAGLFPVPSLAVTRVPLVINEAFPDRAVPWPITTGIPFPRGALKDAKNCRLVDDTGKEQPLQATVSATWDAEKTSIRWLTIDFIAEPGRSYALEFGEGLRPANFTRYLPAFTGQTVTHNTGRLSLEFNRHHGPSLKSVRFDRNGNGTASDDEVTVSGPEIGEHYLVDQKGIRSSSGWEARDRNIAFEALGPTRSCIRVDGYYTGPGGKRIASYRTHYHVFADLGLIKVIDELRFIRSTKETRFSDIGFSLNLHLPTDKRKVVVDKSGEPGNQPLSIDWRPDTQSIASCQQTYRHYGNPECVGEVAMATPAGTTKILTTERIGEWIQVADDQAAVTASMRWFWQQFPKEWEVTNDALTLHYWSPQAGELDFGKEGIEKFFGPGGEKYLRADQDKHNSNPVNRFFYHADMGAIERGEADGLGINKHHEFWLIFSSAKDAKIAQDYARHAAHPPLCLASSEWNCSTDVFGPLAARPNNSRYEAAVDKIFDLGRQGQADFGDYGWWLFGAGPHYSYHTDEATGKLYADSRRFEFHTYGKETQLWWNYLRSGERKFYDWAIPAENHWCDIAVAHEPTKIHCDWLGGTEQKGRTLHWRPGEWSIDNPTHYIRTHDRAEAWLRGGAQFWASYHRTLETTTLAYYITGDPRYNQVISYWRDYFKDLAGKTNHSTDWKPWHQEQAWYQTFKDDPQEKTWAEMIRDYAPFSSGSRHQQTLFFNLATLYEHTWDPQIKQVLEEYAHAFLDPKHPIGVWRSQDNSLPAYAEAPAMAHFWVPALWKYERVTRDPRMKEILAKYFDAAYAADPFREFEDVGVYSNAYCGYAYYFTRDPRYLTLAQKELDQLLPNSLPLKNPQEINQRLYNPYAPAKTFTAVPRLIWALQQGEKEGRKPGMMPLRMQRTVHALYKSPGKELKATLWGFEPKLTIVTPAGEPFAATQLKTRQYASDIQPFDRILPNYECYLHELTIPANEPAGNYLIMPRLELAVLETNSTAPVLWNAAAPLALKPGEAVLWLSPESTVPPDRDLPVTAHPAADLRAAIVNDRVQLRFQEESRARLGWFRLNRPVNECWVIAEPPHTKTDVQNAHDRSLTDPSVITRGLPSAPQADRSQAFVAGRFGDGAAISSQRMLRIPDHVVKGGEKHKLFNEQQGTIEFWIRRKYDERINPAKPLLLLTNGRLSVLYQSSLPLNEWAHLAVVWYPYDDRGSIQHVYVNGRDAANYRSINWDGYSAPRPSAGPKNAKWLEEFLLQAREGSEFEIDELRVSTIPRYADLSVNYGPQQTFNPYRFQPPDKPFAPDEHTTLLLHFDQDLKSAAGNIEGRFE